MIPPFNDDGYLPPGIHPATLAEVIERFGREPELRRVQAESLGWLVDLARRAGVQRLLVNGSFVTDAWEPNDVDCVLLLDTEFCDQALKAELRSGLPFLQLQLAGQVEFEWLVETFFATDDRWIRKGLVEILLW